MGDTTEYATVYAVEHIPEPGEVVDKDVNQIFTDPVSGVHMYKDSSDTIYEWDESKRAWFPKLDEQFLAAYFDENYTYTSKPASNPCPQTSGLVTEPVHAKPVEKKSPPTLPEPKPTKPPAVLEEGEIAESSSDEEIETKEVEEVEVFSDEVTNQQAEQKEEVIIVPKKFEELDINSKLYQWYPDQDTLKKPVPWLLETPKDKLPLRKLVQQTSFQYYSLYHRLYFKRQRQTKLTTIDGTDPNGLPIKEEKLVEEIVPVIEPLVVPPLPGLATTKPSSHIAKPLPNPESSILGVVADTGFVANTVTEDMLAPVRHKPSVLWSAMDDIVTISQAEELDPYSLFYKAFIEDAEDITLDSVIEKQLPNGQTMEEYTWNDYSKFYQFFYKQIPSDEEYQYFSMNGYLPLDSQYVRFYYGHYYAEDDILEAHALFNSEAAEKWKKVKAEKAEKEKDKKELKEKEVLEDNSASVKIICTKTTAEIKKKLESMEQVNNTNKNVTTLVKNTSKYVIRVGPNRRVQTCIVSLINDCNKVPQEVPLSDGNKISRVTSTDSCKTNVLNTCGDVLQSALSGVISTTTELSDTNSNCDKCVDSAASKLSVDAIGADNPVMDEGVSETVAVLESDKNIMDNNSTVSIVTEGIENESLKNADTGTAKITNEAVANTDTVSSNDIHGSKSGVKTDISVSENPKLDAVKDDLKTAADLEKAFDPSDPFVLPENFVLDPLPVGKDPDTMIRESIEKIAENRVKQQLSWMFDQGISSTGGNNNLAGLMENDIEKLAVDEIRKEAEKRHKEYHTLGVSAWMKPTMRPNKRFLSNILVSTLRDPVVRRRSRRGYHNVGLRNSEKNPQNYDKRHREEDCSMRYQSKKHRIDKFTWSSTESDDSQDDRLVSTHSVQRHFNPSDKNGKSSSHSRDEDRDENDKRRCRNSSYSPSRSEQYYRSNSKYFNRHGRSYRDYNNGRSDASYSRGNGNSVRRWARGRPDGFVRFNRATSKPDFWADARDFTTKTDGHRLSDKRKKSASKSKHVRKRRRRDGSRSENTHKDNTRKRKKNDVTETERRSRHKKSKKRKSKKRHKKVKKRKLSEKRSTETDDGTDDGTEDLSQDSDDDGYSENKSESEDESSTGDDEENRVDEDSQNDSYDEISDDEEDDMFDDDESDEEEALEDKSDGELSRSDADGSDEGGGDEKSNDKHNNGKSYNESDTRSRSDSGSSSGSDSSRSERHKNKEETRKHRKKHKHDKDGRTGDGHRKHKRRKSVVKRRNKISKQRKC